MRQKARINYARIIYIRNLMKDIESLYAHLQHVKDLVFSEWSRPLVEYGTELEKTLAILADDESRDTYLRDMAFCVMSQNLQRDKSSNYSGPVTSRQWNMAFNHVACEGGGITNTHKEMACPETATAKFDLDYCRTATFVFEQYRYKNDVIVEPNDVCLDFGACFGDASIYFVEKGADKSYAFEIDKMNLACLKQNIEKLGYANIEIAPCAVSDTPGKAHYAPAPNNTGGGRIFREKPAIPSYEVRTVTIDGFCDERGIRPDFIKMDIEGAEVQAIMGGIKTFTDTRPKFAICIYHKFEHRFEIPLMLANMLPDYDFYVKKSHPVYETVFFGCPRERRRMA